MSQKVHLVICFLGVIAVQGAAAEDAGYFTYEAFSPLDLLGPLESEVVRLKRDAPALPSTASPEPSAASPSDDYNFDRVDQNEEETNTMLLKNNITKIDADYHMYYNSTIFQDEEMVKSFWQDMKNMTVTNMLSKSHRRAMSVQLSFDFPFYGEPVRNVTVATGGFIYTGDYVHSWLAATQYIAPLMANFDTSLSNDSFVKFSDNGTVFTVTWENVKLQDKADWGSFTFSASLYATGDIVFTYNSVPVTIESIQDDKHPVKVGLSDAYINETNIFFARRKTIYEYHRLNFSMQSIKNWTVIHLTALPTCQNFTDCASCLKESQVFKCLWCPAINRCSTGTDRRRQEWFRKGCDKTNFDSSAIAMCPPITPEVSVSQESRHPDGDHDATVPTKSSFSSSLIKNNKLSVDDFDDKIELETHETPHTGVGIFVGFMLLMALISVIGLWLFYANRKPHTYMVLQQRYQNI